MLGTLLESKVREEKGRREEENFHLVLFRDYITSIRRTIDEGAVGECYYSSEGYREDSC